MDEIQYRKICIRCGGTIIFGENRGRSRMFCETCLPEHQQERERIRADNARAASGKPRLGRCVRCEGPREEQGYWCRECKKLHDEEERRRQDRTMTPYDGELPSGSLPRKVIREPSFSARFSGAEIDRMAKEHHTSYGKFRAWIDSRKRLPRPGEEMF